MYVKKFPNPEQLAVEGGKMAGDRFLGHHELRPLVRSRPNAQETGSNAEFGLPVCNQLSGAFMY